MSLIKSISGIRGTIGGKPGESLTPLDVLKFTSAYAMWLANRFPSKKLTVVIGRDARTSGPMVRNLVVSALQGMGINVHDLGLSTTPTVEYGVMVEKAAGGIIITASHNPAEWNALKLLNEQGEFLSAQEGEKILQLAEGDFCFANVKDLGTLVEDDSYLWKHIEAVANLKLVDVDAIRNAELTVVCDCINSTGGIFIPALLKRLGVKKVIELYCEPDGNFQHNPEPLPKNLSAIAEKVCETNADLGVVVDPDVDRLALICENGDMFGEEYTLVSIADFVLSHSPGNTVSNLSSTRALRDVTLKHGGSYMPAAVGEVNVVAQMKSNNAIIGGEGNGGVIYPELHYGRDALVGIALFLTHLAHSKCTCSDLRASYPSYFMSKNRIDLSPEINVDEVLKKVADKYAYENVNTIDGVKIDFHDEWVHLRKSNTEPIIRVYSESSSPEKAQQLADKIIADVKAI